MKPSLKLATLVLTLFTAKAILAQQAAPPAAPATAPTVIQKSVEAFLRNFYALGPTIQITVAPPKDMGNSGIQEVSVDVKTPDGAEKVKMYLSKDGRYLMRGELNDLNSDPLAENRSKMVLDNAPVTGNPNATITLVEYSDFQCPVCRILHDGLRGLLPKYPQVKVIFKDYPIEAIHPWARTGALAGRCAYMQQPSAFWKMYDLIYDNQELMSATNAYDKVVDFAGQAGLNQAIFKSCLSSPEAAQAIDASLANGNLVEVHSTPTVFINGRRVVGADPHTIQQFLDYEIAQQKSANKP